MIKFFRKIRQKLLSENRISKYLVYAIGEILLVVIGILIALAINNYNNNKKSEKELHQLLESVAVELKQNFDFFNKQAKFQTKNINYLKQISNRNYDKVDLANLFIQINKNPTHMNPSISYKTLIQLGKLNEIRDQQLIDQLNTYYNISCPEYSEFVSYHQKSVAEMEPIFLKTMTIKATEKIDTAEAIKVLENNTLISYINLQLSNFSILNKGCKKRIENIIELDEQINKYLYKTKN